MMTIYWKIICYGILSMAGGIAIGTTSSLWYSVIIGAIIGGLGAWLSLSIDRR